MRERKRLTAAMRQLALASLCRVVAFLNTGVRRKTSLAGRQHLLVNISSHATLIQPILGPDALSISNHRSISGSKFPT